jgi:hypothetical protein
VMSDHNLAVELATRALIAANPRAA